MLEIARWPWRSTGQRMHAVHACTSPAPAINLISPTSHDAKSQLQTTLRRAAFLCLSPFTPPSPLSLRVTASRQRCPSTRSLKHAPAHNLCTEAHLTSPRHTFRCRPPTHQHTTDREPHEIWPAIPAARRVSMLATSPNLRRWSRRTPRAMAPGTVAISRASTTMDTRFRRALSPRARAAGGVCIRSSS